MTLLYLTHSCPYPPHKGDRIRSFNILKYLAKSHDVRLVYPSFTAEDMQNREELKKYCVSVDTVYIHKMKANIQCMLGFFTKTPLTLHYFYSRDIYEIVRSLDFDIAFVDCSSMALYIIDIDRPKIIDFVDVDYEKWLLYAERASFPKSIIYNREHKRLKEFENYINKLFDYSIVISEREKKLLAEQEKTTVVSNGVDFKIFSPMKSHKKNTVIFSGAMNYFANIDGVFFFYEEVFPLIKEAVPNAKFIIAGMKPVKKIRQLACQDVMVTGYVPDMRSYVAQSTVFIAPLRIAKGLQNKVLEAMAMEVPVVATAATNGGIGAQDQQEILVADSPAAFSQATVALLRDAALRKAVTANAKRFVLQHFRWETNLSRLDDIIALVAQPTIEKIPD
jgi:sugar transferase (PEP-CTERM/EpsH1 system associated)